MGSKQNLIDFIFENLDKLKYHTAFDAFSGSGAVAYEFKRKKKQVTTNDFLHFSYIISKALTENNSIRVDEEVFEKLLILRPDAPKFVRNFYSDLFFTKEECYFLDSLWMNISELKNQYQKALAIAAACRACQKKRPRGIFTVIGKKGWDGRRDLKMSVQEQFANAVRVFNDSVFDNGKNNTALWSDIMQVEARDFDLVYLDPPYWSPLSDNDYVRRYHFVEGYSLYWQNLNIDLKTKSRKFKSYKSDFSKLDSSIEAFKKLFNRYSKSIIAVSYSSNSQPTKEQMINMLREVKSKVDVFEADHCYSFANQANKNRKNRVKEYLFIGRD
jgi:DNA adenine methylase